MEAGDVRRFDAAFFGRIGHVVRNASRSVVLSLTRGAWGPPRSRARRRPTTKLWASASFATMADMAMAMLGGDLKRKEALTERFADVFSWIPRERRAAALRGRGPPQGGPPYLHWAMETCLAEIQVAFDGIFRNFDVPLVGWFFRGPVAFWSRLNALSGGPSDRVMQKVAKAMQVCEQRERMTSGMYVPTALDEAVGEMEHALVVCTEAAAIHRRIREAVKTKKLAKKAPALLRADALKLGIISAADADLLDRAEPLARPWSRSTPSPGGVCAPRPRPHRPHGAGGRRERRWSALRGREQRRLTRSARGALPGGSRRRPTVGRAPKGDLPQSRAADRRVRGSFASTPTPRAGIAPQRPDPGRVLSKVPMTSTPRRFLRALGTHALLAPGLATCAMLYVPEDLRWPEDITGRSFVGASSGWAFVEADVDLKNGTGPLADPTFGGSDVGSSTTDLDPIFGLGLKYFHYLTNNWLVGAIIEHRIFDPRSTRPSRPTSTSTASGRPTSSWTPATSGNRSTTTAACDRRRRPARASPRSAPTAPRATRRSRLRAGDDRGRQPQRRRVLHPRLRRRRVVPHP